MEGDIRILDRDLLVTKKKIVPGSVNESALFKMITATTGTMMPPEDKPRLAPEQIADIKAWIAAGAPAYDAAQLAEQAPEGKPDEKPITGRLGNEYTLQSILNDVRKLKQESGKNILLDGSSVLAHTLIENDLVDEYALHVYPLVLGGGKRLFPEEGRINLKLVEASPLPSGVVYMRYRRG